MKVKRGILLVLIIVWAVAIFMLSGQSGGDSSGFSRRIVEIFTKSEEIINVVEPYIRKLAHFSEYALGGMLFLALFSTYKWSDRRKMFTAIVLGIWYAATDEIHQLMVPGRNGSIFDVYLDTLGFSTGVCVMLILIKIKYMIVGTKKMQRRKGVRK